MLQFILECICDTWIIGTVSESNWLKRLVFRFSDWIGIPESWEFARKFIHLLAIFLVIALLLAVLCLLIVALLKISD